MSDIKNKIDAANDRAMDYLINGQPVWIDILPAEAAIPGFKRNLLLHAGPPVKIENIAPPLKTTLCGAAIHEGIAKAPDEAWAMIKSGDILIASAQDYSCACGAVMVISASTPVIVAEDKRFGGFGYCSIHPGPEKKCLRWGYYDNEVETALVWFKEIYGPALGEAVRKLGGIDIKNILARTAGMGDENHVRQLASSYAIILDLIPALLENNSSHRDDVIRALSINDKFFLHIMMAGTMSVLQSVKNIPLSTIMVGMGGNGTDFGLQFSGTGKQWFTVKAPKILGQLLNPSWTEDDLCGFLGDSCVTEIYGLGGLSAIAGPAFVRLTGGTFADAKKCTEDARAVCLGEHTWAPIPWDDYRGFPVGVDMRKVVATNITPTSHGGSTRLAGGQGGAGMAKIPIECFKLGLKAFSEQLRGGDND